VADAERFHRAARLRGRYGARMMWFIVVVVVVVLWALIRALGHTSDQQVKHPAPADVPVTASLAELQQRDMYMLTKAEFEVVLAADRTEDERHAPTSEGISRSEYLSPEEEARYVSFDNGMPNIRIVRERGQLVMVVPEGIVNYSSRALHREDIYPFRVRGSGHYEDAVLAASLSPGSKIRLVREPDNEYDANAIAIYSGKGIGPLGYVNKQNAARLAKLIDAGESFEAITLSGSPAGRDGDSLTVLVARPDVIAHMLRKGSQTKVISKGVKSTKVIGEMGALAQDLYAAGTPPLHGLAVKHERSPRVAKVKIGDKLCVERVGDHWVVSDANGELGWCRWLPSDDGKVHAVTGVVTHLPSSGTLHVERLRVDPSGKVIDFSGYVVPDVEQVL